MVINTIRGEAREVYSTCTELYYRIVMQLNTELNETLLRVPVSLSLNSNLDHSLLIRPLMNN